MDIGDTATRIEITMDGDTIVIDLLDLTGEESNLFRKAVGIPPAQAMVTGLDLDGIAALIWLHRRKRNRSLTYEQVAKTVTWRNVDMQEVAGDGETPEDASPEA